MSGVLSRERGPNRRLRRSAAARTLGTVLLVDDRSYDGQPIVLRLREAHLAAPTLPNSARAIALLRRRDEPLDAVVCCGAMTGLAGFVREASALRPNLRFVLIDAAGRSTDGAVEHLERIRRAYRRVVRTTSAGAIVDAIVELLGTPAQLPRPTVVLVDGNPDQRQQNERALRRAECATIALAAPEQALSLATRPGVRIDALVVTSSYHGTFGLDLARSIQRARGPLPVVLLREERESAPPSTPGVDVLARPYSPDDLTDTVSRLLTGESTEEAA